MSSNSLIDLGTAQGQVPDYMRQALDYIHDSQAIQRLAVGHVESILNGSVTVTDPTNPFTTLLGVSAANASAAVLANATGLRKRYPALANTPQELYHHMSDKDYEGRFASPHTQKVLCLVALSEIKSRMVTQSDGSKLAVIQRFSSVVVENTTFTLLYPVEVREALHGDMNVQYDLSVAHPLQPMASSVIYWTTRESTRNTDTKFLQLELDMVQVRASTYQYDLNPSTGIDKTVTLVDPYCTAQVWYKSQAMSKWQEIRTTHSDMVYDVNTPTAVLTVAGNQFSVRVPMVYFTSGMVSGRLRVVVYTTKGPVFINADGKTLEHFQSNWAGDNSEVVTTEMAAWHAVQSKFMMFQGIAQGGTSELTFEQLRERVIAGAVGPQLTPITPAQRQLALESDGYTLRQYVDSTTTRQILASKALPASRDTTLITPGSATISTVLATTAALKASPWVADNGDRVTITPDALWQIRSGVVRMVSGQEMMDLMASDAESRMSLINAGGFLYSPYYYVVDATTDLLSVRPYHLDDPRAIVDKYLGENDTTGMQIEINELALINTGNGWQLRVSTLSNAAWKAQDISYRHAQLSFDPPGVGASAAVNGEVVVGDDGEDIFVFHMPSGYDIDANHKVSHLGFHAITAEAREVFSALNQTFRLVFATSSPLPSSAQGHSLDNTLVMAMLPNRIAAVGAQQVRLTFGTYLEHLWAACRTMAPGQPWQTYTTDIPAVYDKDVYEINPATGLEVWFDSNGDAFFKKLAEAGDTIVENGEVVYAHRRGDVIFSGGEPVAITADALQRQFDMLFLEGCYYFATDASTTQYTREMISVLTNYIVVDLPKFAGRVLEKTSIFFYPKVTLGSIAALIDAGVVAQIQADQSLTIRLGVHKRVFDNDPLRKQLEAKTIQTIQTFFTREALSISELTSELRRVYSGDVLSVYVTGLGGNNNANAITLLNANERCSLKKRVHILDSGEFTVREDVTIDFFEHTT